MHAPDPVVELPSAWVFDNAGTRAMFDAVNAQYPPLNRSARSDVPSRPFPDFAAAFPEFGKAIEAGTARGCGLHGFGHTESNCRNPAVKARGLAREAARPAR